MTNGDNKQENGGSERLDFIRQIVADDMEKGDVGRACAYAFSAGAERLPAYRPRQEHLPEFRHRRGVRRQVQSAV